MSNLPSALRIMTGRMDWSGKDTHELNVLSASADRIEYLEAKLRHYGIEATGEFICACGLRKEDHITDKYPF